MPRFFFHVQDGAFLSDTEGVDLGDLDAVRDHAITAIRRSISDGALKGADRTHWTMIVADEAGVTQLVVPFSYALSRN